MKRGCEELVLAAAWSSKRNNGRLWSRRRGFKTKPIEHPHPYPSCTTATTTTTTRQALAPAIF
ncbi:GD15818 [Drosophila simulans]|uniref:GD15818 n=1 Tax=Drosophila simulans TaxID=7240 RepID=B4R548_DROSI|nr:GD15818 [Drosophila simulans]